jgi:hypothetical protein
MTINLFDYQEKAVSELKTGSILWGGVGSGKTLTSLAYYYTVECGGSIGIEMTPMTKPKDLYVITTARKRDSLDWEKEAAYLAISNKREFSASGVLLTVDSWNNIAKYKDVKDAFFIFDEQRVVGSGAWVKSFLKITKCNNWILLSATPGDTWMDYVPVFVANGFYKNRTQFIREHVVFNTFANYPKIDRYVEEGKLRKLRNLVLVKMAYERKTIHHVESIICEYKEYNFNRIYRDRWNPFKNKPIKDAAEACYAMRQVVNSHPSRFEAILKLLETHPKLIIFYNFDYELDILRRLNDVLDIPVAEYNGHIHEPIPQGRSWIYLAQYISASEAWNCIETNVVVLYSKNYSYKITTQAMGRIDRQNTPFLNLYYYFLSSDSPIDREIGLAYQEKRNFNEAKFFEN